MSKQIQNWALPASCMGNERRITVIRYIGDDPKKKAYIQAGLHADEPPGIAVMHYLMDLLDHADIDGRIKDEILLVPVANPIGISQWQADYMVGRYEFATGVNFNRSHIDVTGKVAEKIKGRLTYHVDENVALIRKEFKNMLEFISPADEGEHLKWFLLTQACDADIVIDLHCDTDAVLHMYTGTPLWPDASDLSAQMGSVVTLLADNSGGHPFDEACSRIWWDLAKTFPDFPIPPACFASTLELRGAADVSRELAEKDARNLLRFLQRRGFISGDAGPVPDLINDATPLSGVEYIKSTCAGIVTYRVAAGDHVKKGDTIGDVINPDVTSAKDRIQPVKTTINGIVFTGRADRFARPGSTIAKVAGKTPIKGKGKYLLTT